MATPIPEGRYHRLRSGLRLHFTEIGTPSTTKPSVLFIHGGGPGASGYSNFKRNLPVIAAAGYHVVAPDLLGYGLSDKPDDIDYTSTLHLGTLRELVAALGIASVVPLGNSLGGNIALEYALDYPESVPALALTAPGGVAHPATFWGETEGGRALAAYGQDAPLGEDAFRELMSLLVHTASTVDDALMSERYAVSLMQPRCVFTSIRVQPTWERLHEIECPILCFWGADDRCLPHRLALVLLEKCLDVKLVISNGAGHWYMLELPDDFNRELIDFLGSVR